MNKSAPFFSVVMPAYNRAHLISATIKSVTDQTFKDWELIIVDDGSKDNTKAVVEGLNDSRIKYIYQNNAERSAARNNGIRNSSGKYVCFLDSDDFYIETHLYELFQFITEKKPTACLIFVDQIINKEGKDILSQTKTAFDKLHGPAFFISNSIVPGRICVTKSVFETHLFDPEIVVVEDTDLWFRISCKYPCYHLNRATFIYHLHEDNSVNIQKYNAFYPRLKGLLKTFAKPEASMLPVQLKNTILSDTYFGIIRYYEATGSRWSAWKTTLTSLAKYPTLRTKQKIYLLIKFTPLLQKLLKAK